MPKIHRITESDYLALRAEGSGGICLHCGTLHDSDIEPNAERLECEDCGCSTVVGIQLALQLERIAIIPDPEPDDILDIDEHDYRAMHGNENDEDLDCFDYPD